MSDTSVMNRSVESRLCPITSEENNEYSVYNGQFQSSDSSRGGEIKMEAHAGSAVSVGCTTSPELDEVLPLTGKPYFVIVMSKSYVKRAYHLAIPQNFIQLLPSASVVVGLWCRNKKWEVHYHGDRFLKRFDSGWNKFVVDNNLNIGDACVFELIDDKNLDIRVQILDGKIPHDFPSSMGQDADTPIVLDE